VNGSSVPSGSLQSLQDKALHALEDLCVDNPPHLTGTELRNTPGSSCNRTRYIEFIVEFTMFFHLFH
jgi:hypothetical protein